MSEKETFGGMTPRLRAVLARLCERLGPLYSTQAVKLPYLVDVIAKSVLGHQIAEGTYQAWEHGVVTKEVFRFIKHEPDADSVFSVRPHRYSEGGKQISLVRRPRLEQILTPDELAVVDLVADRYGAIPPEELGYLTKRLNTEIPTDQWGSNHSALVDEEAFLRLSPAWQTLGKRIASADLDDRSRWSEPINDDPMAHFLKALNA
jgi:hypothetical protein